MTTPLQRETLVTDRHATSYLTAGPDDAPLMVFVHGWPEQALSWRHQLADMADAGWRAVAPDMRGYGHSATYDTHAAFSQEEIVADMIELIDHLGADRAVWVGHDWGSPVAWNVAAHHPDRTAGVASLCVPYRTIELGLDVLVSLVDRDVYPVDEYPLGQWDYQRYYEESFDEATAFFGTNSLNTVTALFRRADPATLGQPAGTATVRRDGGWLGGIDEIPPLPHDDTMITTEELAAYAEGLDRNGWFGPDSWYMNHAANAAYAARLDDPTIELPALFLHATYDGVCETLRSPLAGPMREHCTDLVEVTVDSGHWMAQEEPEAVAAALLDRFGRPS